MIRTFFVMNSHGAILYSDEYENTFQIDLMSGFLSAIYSFMQNAIYTNELDTLEVGGLRFIFDIQEMEEDKADLIFVILCDRTDNIAFIKPKLTQCKWKFLELFYNEIKVWETIERELFDKYQPIEREIIQQMPLKLNQETELLLLKSFHKLLDASEFIIGAALLTQSGHVLFSFLDNKFLQNVLKTMEGRFHSGYTKIQTIMSKEPDGILVMIGKDEFVCGVLFQQTCPLGTALIMGEQFTNSLNEIIQKLPKENKEPIS